MTVAYCSSGFFRQRQALSWGVLTGQRGVRVQSLPVVVLGFILGMLHATDADHIVAVSTIVSRERSVRGAARIGLLWGMGHTFTIIAVGSAIIVFNLTLPPRLELAMELCVALMLIALGVITLLRVRRQVRGNLASALAAGLSEHAHAEPVHEAHLHPHAHGDYVHAHKHGHAAADHGHAGTPLSWLDRHAGGLSLYQALRPLSIGVVHGLAGSAAVALLVLAQIRDPWWAVPYLLLFGVGTTVGMMLVTSAIAVPFMRADRLPALNFGLQLVAGALSLGLGCWLAWQLGVAGGLFVLAPAH
jgi:ABC-type nickel/cobalt efflux system permease component RcnA